MLDFSRVQRQEITFGTLVANLKISDLRDLTNEMVDFMLEIIIDCSDTDVSFVPFDPDAHDHYAATADEANISWTLGHVIVHTTASAEESAVHAVTLARGLAVNGRSRYEVPWQSITTIEQCRLRLAESRRMRLASLDMWPGSPHLKNRQQPWPGMEEVNAIGRFVLGLHHDSNHLQQLQDIVSQAKAARHTP